METYTDVLLVTANVGSLFDNVSSLLRFVLKPLQAVMLPEDYT